MNRFHWISRSFCSLLFVLTISGMGFAKTTDPLTTINFEIPVHFLAPDGSPMMVPSDTYSVEAAEEWIRLVPGERHDAVLIEAKKGLHELELPDALALSVTGAEDNSQDLHHVILLLPNGESLESTGTYSGIRPRGFFDRAMNNVKKQTNQAYKKARSTAKKTVSQAKRTAGKATKQAQQQTQKAVSQAKRGAKNAQKQMRKGTQQAMSQAKKGAGNVRKQVRKGTQQAVSTAKKGIQTARNAALQAKRQVEKTARRVAGKIQGGVQAGMNQIKNNPMTATLQSEIQTLEAVRKLKLEPLFRCLAQASGQGAASVPQMVQQFVTNPPRFANSMINTVVKQWEQNFSEIMGEQLQMLRKPSRTELRPAQVVNMAISSMEKLAQKTPAGRCMMQFTRPHLTALRDNSIRLQQTLMAQTQRIFDTKIAPILLANLNQQLGSILKTAVSLTPQDIAKARVRSRGINQMPTTQGENTIPQSPIVSRGLNNEESKELLMSLIPGLGEIVTVTQAVLADRLLNPQDLYAAATQVENIAKSSNDPRQRQAELRALRTALDPNSAWTEALYIDIGMEILRCVGNLYIDSPVPGGGTWFVKKGVGLLVSGTDTVGSVAQGVAGLIPEVGSGIAAIIREGPDVVLNILVADKIELAVLAAWGFGYDTLIDEAKKALKSGQPYATIQQQAGPLSAILRYLPSKQQVMILASTHTKDTRRALERYNRSVLLLAETAAQ